MIWPTKRLDAVAELCLGKMLDQNKNKGEARKYLANINVRWGHFDLADLREMRFQEKELQRYGLKSGDIVMCEGGEPGRCALWHDQIPGMMFQKALHRIRSRKDVDNQFLFYALFHLGKTSAMESLFTGATIKHLPGEQLAKLEVPVPPLPTQRRIASILGAYDDLIEVNRRRIKVLEEMARGLFEEWFVRFRFPGHENVPILDTPNGPLPEGWQHATVGDFLTLQRGFDLPTSQRQQGAVPVMSASGHHGTHTEAKVSGPGIVTGRSGTIGQVHLSMEDFWPLNTALYVKEYKKAGPAFAKLLLENLDLAKHAAGAAVPTLNRNHIHCLPRAMPPNDLLDRFERIAMTNLLAAHNLRKQSETLTASRDLLLPRLISGQLSVEAAEQMNEAAE